MSLFNRSEPDGRPLTGLVVATIRTEHSRRVEGGPDGRVLRHDRRRHRRPIVGSVDRDSVAHVGVPARHRSVRRPAPSAFIADRFGERFPLDKHVLIEDNHNPSSEELEAIRVTEDGTVLDGWLRRPPPPPVEKLGPSDDPGVPLPDRVLGAIVVAHDRELIRRSLEPAPAGWNPRLGLAFSVADGRFAGCTLEPNVADNQHLTWWSSRPTIARPSRRCGGCAGMQMDGSTGRPKTSQPRCRRDADRPATTDSSGHQAQVQAIVAAITTLLDERESAGSDPASLRAWRKRFLALRAQLDELLPRHRTEPSSDAGSHPRIAESVSYALRDELAAPSTGGRSDAPVSSHTTTFTASGTFTAPATLLTGTVMVDVRGAQGGTSSNGAAGGLGGPRHGVDPRHTERHAEHLRRCRQGGIFRRRRRSLRQRRRLVGDQEVVDRRSRGRRRWWRRHTGERRLRRRWWPRRARPAPSPARTAVVAVVGTAARVDRPTSEQPAALELAAARTVAPARRAPLVPVADRAVSRAVARVRKVAPDRSPAPPVVRATAAPSIYIDRDVLRRMERRQRCCARHVPDGRPGPVADVAGADERLVRRHVRCRLDHVQAQSRRAVRCTHGLGRPPEDDRWQLHVLQGVDRHLDIVGRLQRRHTADFSRNKRVSLQLCVSEVDRWDDLSVGRRHAKHHHRARPNEQLPD